MECYWFFAEDTRRYTQSFSGHRCAFWWIEFPQPGWDYCFYTCWWFTCMREDQCQTWPGVWAVLVGFCSCNQTWRGPSTALPYLRSLNQPPAWGFSCPESAFCCTQSARNSCLAPNPALPPVSDYSAFISSSAWSAIRSAPSPASCSTSMSRLLIGLRGAWPTAAH